MPKLLPLFVALFLSTLAQGQTLDSLQTKPKRHQFYLSLGSGYTKQTVRDWGISSLRYQGDQATFISDLIDKTQLGEHSLQVRFDMGEMEAAQNGSTMITYKGGGGYKYLRNLKKSPLKSLSFSAGGSLDGFWNLRHHQAYSNNAYNNEFYLNLGPTGRAKYAFQLFKQKFLVSYTAQMPLVSFVIRPSFTGTYFDEFIDSGEDGIKGALKSGYFVGMKQYFRFQNEIGFEYYLKGGNGLKVGYNWDFYRLKSEYNPIEAGYRTIQLSLIYKF